MHNRRQAVKLIVPQIMLGHALINKSFAQSEISFEDLFSSLKKNSIIIENTESYRERQNEEYDFYVARALAPRVKPSDRNISERAIDLIVTFEVTSKERYNKLLRSPIWPRGQSGITIGIGYDVGYCSPEWLKDDWAEFIEAKTLSDLEQACRIKGQKAASLVETLKHINIEWYIAYTQFLKNILPRYTAETLNSLPNASKLSDDSLGALVSLVYNRGASFKNTTSRFEEMRAIRLAMVNENFGQIPAHIRGMKRIWAEDPNLKGLLLRRDLEAALFQRGLR